MIKQNKKCKEKERSNSPGLSKRITFVSFHGTIKANEAMNQGHPKALLT